MGPIVVICQRVARGVVADIRIVGTTCKGNAYVAGDVPRDAGGDGGVAIPINIRRAADAQALVKAVFIQGDSSAARVIQNTVPHGITASIAVDSGELKSIV